MYRSGNYRTPGAWLRFDTAAFAVSAALLSLLALLAATGHGPWSYKSCLPSGAATKQSDAVGDLKKVPAAKVPEGKAPVAAAAPVATPAPVPAPIAAAPAGVKETPKPVHLLPASLSMSKQGKVLTLTGLVPTSAIKREITGDAERVLDDGKIIDHLEVDGTVKAANWMQQGAELTKVFVGLRGHPSVEVSGKDVRLTGTVNETAAREAAGYKAAEIFGPDAVIHNLITVIPLSPAVFDIEAIGSDATVSGRVNSEAVYAELIDGATSVFGETHVTDRLAVDDGTSALTWQKNVRKIVEAIKGHEDPAHLRIEGTTAILGGTALSGSEKSDRGTAMQNLLSPDVTIDNRIVIQPLALSVVEVQAANGKVTLSGQVAEDATRSRLAEAASKVFGYGNIADQIVVERKTSAINWIAKSEQALEGLINPGEAMGLRAEGEDIVLTGTVVSEAEREKRGRQAQEAFGAAAVINNKIVIVAPPPPPALETVSPPSVTVDCAALAAGAVVEFDTNKATLTKHGEAALNQIAGCLNGRRYEVAGHTDSTGNEPWNEELSRLRARSAVRYLVLKGADNARLTAKGLGSSVPVATNATPEGRAQNRRITFTAQP